MSGIQGIGGVPEPRPDRPNDARDRNRTEGPANAPAQDDVVISSEAQAAARVANLIQTTSTQPDIRPERVEAARESIERGDFRRPEIVEQVADRLSRLLNL